ncbi:MarR family transcriptional regulator [Pedobacter changchengzhani]|uniref:MarR family transcriptional regulator n=1 Tax=Pedobacter changchengzhani TaxID=2529274 RepID=A0A4R5MKL4_9SPHI|nr:MarR family winged helix-turn-helix transcriptional regulator [Pedobacter changchengzhani]TDG36191.1 MarR family transcriptional regulator [Pedobacter changchengzhani]
MYYDLTKEVIDLIKIYDAEKHSGTTDVYSFTQWMNEYFKQKGHPTLPEPDWGGKSDGRSPDSVINTSLVHLYRYAKLHAKDAISGTEFSTPDDFIYLISLASLGSMTKTALIKLNIHEKSAGIQIVNRLIHNGWAEQATTDADKRNRIISITDKGRRLLEESIPNIRQASNNVTEPLNETEKIDLIRLLLKLEDFHKLNSSGFVYN